MKTENYSFDIKVKTLDILCKLSEKHHIPIDLLIEEALRDILEKYNRN